MDAQQKIAKARISLLNREPFYGELAMRLIPVPKSDLQFRTMAVTADSMLYYDDSFVNNLTGLELKGVLAHEILHLVLNHLTRRGIREEDRWGSACDYAVNDILIDAGFFLPKNVLYDKKYKGMTAEQIYNHLPPDPPPRGFDSHLFWTGQTVVAYEQEWKSLTAMAKASSKGRGYMPAELEEAIDRILNPRVDWRTLLWQFVSSTAKDDYRWSPPNRHYIHMGLYLPSLRSETVELAVAIDTSGSISIEQLQQFVSEVQAILDLNLKVTLHYFECDAEVHKKLEMHSRDDVLSMVGKLTGRGGTDFRPVFRRIEHDGLAIEGLIFLTDGNGTYPAKAPEYKVMWILTQDVEVPFGEKAIMEAD